MFSVITVNLSADATAASPDFGQAGRGELSADDFAALLERFRAVDSLQNDEAEPHLLVTARAGRFLVRTGHGKLLLYNALDAAASYAELSAAEIVALLDQPAAIRAEAGAEPPPPPAKEVAPHRGIAFAIFVAGLALNGYTLYSAFYTESVNQKAAVTLLTAADELAARQNEVVGTYATGTQPGDRLIAVGADGRVTFSEVGDAKSINNGTDTYRLGRHGKTLCLATTDSGVIDILNIDTLVYYRDTYKRTR